MASYAVVVGKKAKRVIQELAKTEQRRIVRALEKLENDPKHPGVKKLSNNPDFWRVCVGDYRVIYTIRPKERSICVLIVGHRRQVYRNIDNLDALLQKLVSKHMLPRDQE